MKVPVYSIGTRLWSVHAYSHNEKTCDCGMCVNGLVVGWCDKKSFSFECPNSKEYKRRVVVNVSEFEVAGYQITSRTRDGLKLSYLFYDLYGGVDESGTRLFCTREAAEEHADNILRDSQTEYQSCLSPDSEIQLPDLGETAWSYEDYPSEKTISGGFYTPEGLVQLSIKAKVSRFSVVYATTIASIEFRQLLDDVRLDMLDDRGNECFQTREEAEQYVKSLGGGDGEEEFLNAVENAVALKSRVNFFVD